MRQKFFHIPVTDSSAVEAELNSFCDQQSVSHLEKHLVMDGQHSFWAVCVTWAGNTEKPVGKAKAGGGKRKIDYKDELSDKLDTEVVRVQCYNKASQNKR